MKPIYILTLFLFIPTIILSQVFTGLIIDSLTNQKLSYVNIGISDKNIGTVSNLNGNYAITLSEIYNSDTLVFSLIGYKTHKIKVSELENNMTIALGPITYEIPEIEIFAFSKTKKVGNNTTNHRFNVGFSNYQLGSEIGSLIKISRKSRVKSITFSMVQCKPDSITFRLNIYNTKSNSYPDQNILQKPYYFTLRKGQAHTLVTLNLDSMYLVVDGDIVVSVECLEDVALHTVSFSALMFNGKCFIRKGSQSGWEKYPIGMGISAEIEFN